MMMPDNASIATPNPARSVFPQGPSFSLEDFSSRDFIVKEFIEALSDTAISHRRSAAGTVAASNQPFDPKPLIRTFEHAQRRLGELSGDLEIRENELSAAVRRAEAQHSQNLTTLGRKLRQTIESFQQLDTSLNGNGLENGEGRGAAGGMGNMAVETGRKLEELDRQRRRALDAHFLLECWDGVCNRGEIALLENLRRSGTAEAKVRSAHIARQLLRISQRLDPESWQSSSKPSNGNGNGKYGSNSSSSEDLSTGHSTPRRNTREIIEKFSETLEKDLLKQFDDFYRKANFEGMKDCATVLQDFNGGSSVIALFVNQHQFFIDRSQLVTEEVGGDAESWEKMADPDAELPGVEPSLQSLLDEVKVVVQEESAIIRRAFPYYEQVLGKFLQRVFQQSIQQRLEMVLDKASGVSSLAFLRCLQSSRGYISTLIDDLKAHGLTEHPESISSQTALLLDHQLEELFVPYFVGSSYIEREKRTLEELFHAVLFKFTSYHARRKKAATTFMASLSRPSTTELLSATRDAFISRLDSPEMPPTQRRMLLHVAKVGDVPETQRLTEIKISDEEGQPSLNDAKRMLKWLAEAVGRGLELSVNTDTHKDVSALLTFLLANMGDGYVDVCLDAALEAATAQESGKNEPDLGFLMSVRTTISVTTLMVMCVNAVLLPLATSSITTRRDMEKRISQTTSRIEEKINTIEQKTIDATLAWVSRLLSGQRKNDFRPRESDNAAWLEMLQTPTCASICTFLTRVHNIARTALPSSGSNVRQVLTEIALGTRGLLLEHFKRFAVSGPGGLMVTKDMTQYADLLKSWDIDEETKGPGGALDVLLEVGNLFVIGVEALRERIRGGAASGATGTSTGPGRSAGGQMEAKLSVQEVRAYVSRREDSNTLAMQQVLNAL
ncbi:Sec10 family protein [Penicillium ucsense]|uniref:Sec10 family protein n=1 Tax=Penicillium ucsense TaxID=2839758 RepID=A0A8J8WFN4_9EURO|nr:Sec10 family protein [Penicillium ucsense]KAF7732651.1 Sec10 family protein [Penicillium ucsense]